MTGASAQGENKVDRRPVVFVGDDYSVGDILDRIADRLTADGCRVIREKGAGNGRMQSYEEDSWPRLFGEADVILISSRTHCPRALLQAAPNLRGVVFPTIGTDAVDLGDAAELGLVIGHGPVPENATGMAEATVMLIAALFLDLHGKERMTREHLPRPRPTALPARLVSGKTIGLVGFGRIARGVAERLAGWGVRIRAFDPYVDPATLPAHASLCDLDTLLAESDLVSIHVALTGETRRMIGRDQVARMKAGSFLINNSRGGAVDEQAIMDALRSGHLAGAALDVFEQEPLAADSQLRDVPNLILTSHIVGHSREANLASIPAAVENVRRILAGQPPLYTRNPEILDEWTARMRAMPRF